MLHVKTRAFRLLALLIAGAVVNIAVAWGAMLLDPPPHPQSSAYSRPALRDPASILQRVFPQLNTTGRVCTGNTYHGAGWRELFASCQDELAVNIIAQVRIHQAGWPLSVVQGRIEEHGGSTRRVGFIAVPGASANPLSVRHKHLPTIPVWPGFTINTIVYAAVLWVVWFTPGMAKRYFRERCGLCPACAYPIGASPVCTECGTRVRPGDP